MNFSELKNKIVDAGTIAFGKVRASHPNDKFYFFCLYTSGEFNYLYPTCSSYEGLRQVAEKYKQDEYYQNKSIEYLQNDLKWSPCDSPLHLEGEDEFESLQGDMQLVFEELDGLYDPSDWSNFNRYVSEIESCVGEALLELDNNGVFGREGTGDILLNFVMGDQSDEDRIRIAKLLNSAEQVANYEADIST